MHLARHNRTDPGRTATPCSVTHGSLGKSLAFSEPQPLPVSSHRMFETPSKEQILESSKASKL
jgi:hypothetical protein